MYSEPYNFEPALLTKCVMGALFAGLITVGADEAFNLAYRMFSGFNPSEFFNVATLIFGTLILFLAAGVVYYVLRKLTVYADYIYMAVFFIATVLLFIDSLTVARFTNPELSSQFRFLLAGMILLIGLMCSFLVPYFSKRYKIWF